MMSLRALISLRLDNSLQWYPRALPINDTYKVEKNPKINQAMRGLPTEKVIEGLVSPIESPIPKPFVSDQTIDRALVNKHVFLLVLFNAE
jgi:hypothetical protein